MIHNWSNDEKDPINSVGVEPVSRMRVCVIFLLWTIGLAQHVTTGQALQIRFSTFVKPVENIVSTRHKAEPVPRRSRYEFASVLFHTRQPRCCTLMSSPTASK